MGHPTAMAWPQGAGGDSLSQERWKQVVHREDRCKKNWQEAYGQCPTPNRYTPPSMPSSRGGYSRGDASSRPSTGMSGASDYTVDSNGIPRPVTGNTKERKLRELKGKLLGTLEEIERELVVAQDEKSSRASTRRSTARSSAR